MEASRAFESPVGRLVLTASGEALIRVTWARATDAEPQGPNAGHPVLAEAIDQLSEYFAGTRHAFDLPIAPTGGALQQAVCRAMLAIPYGQTRSYGEIARGLGVAAQPVGQACGGNPIPIVIPCHRVLAADGKLGGFSGGRGAETKLALLRHEGALLV